MKVFLFPEAKGVEEQLSKRAYAENGILPVIDWSMVYLLPEVIPMPSIVVGGESLVGECYPQGSGKAGILCFSAGFPVAEGTGIRGLLEEKKIAPELLLFAGTRVLTPESAILLKSGKIKSVSMKEIAFQGMHDCCDGIMMTARQWESLYLLVNTDVLDSMYSGDGEPGGMTIRELLYFLQRLKLLKNLRCMHIIPAMQGKMMEKIVAKMIVELS